jgi:hypothetical protein
VTDDIASWTIEEICARVPDEIAYHISSSAAAHPPGLWAGSASVSGGHLLLDLGRDPGTEGFKRGWRYVLIEYQDIAMQSGARKLDEGYVTSEAQLLSLFHNVVESARRNPMP